MNQDQPDGQADPPGAASAYWTGGHTKHRLCYHLVWAPKYRKRVLTGPLARRLSELLYEACDFNH